MEISCPEHQRCAHIAGIVPRIIASKSFPVLIRIEPAGTNGFGYDPLFEVVEYHRTFGELGPAVKRAISHRSYCGPEWAAVNQRSFAPQAWEGLHVERDLSDVGSGNAALPGQMLGYESADSTVERLATEINSTGSSDCTSIGNYSIQFRSTASQTDRTDSNPGLKNGGTATV
jgi:hypothetical protein